MERLGKRKGEKKVKKKKKKEPKYPFKFNKYDKIRRVKPKILILNE